MGIVNEGKGLDVSRVAKSRRAFLCHRLGNMSHKILEFGALDNPTFLKSEEDVFFADFFSQDESRARHSKGTRSTTQIVPVDFILRDTTLARAVAIRPSLIIANHVVEHIANPIDWFQEVRSLAAEGAYLFLSVPDKRYTFDYFKPVSDAVDWLRAYDERLESPSFYHILRHLFYHADVNATNAWANNFPSDHLHRINFPDAIAKARMLASSYTDVHCSIFTHDSFRQIFSDLMDTKLIPWRIVDMADVEHNSNEFRVLLTAT